MSSREVLRDYAEYATPSPVLPEGGDAPIDYYCRSIEMQLANLQKQLTDQRRRARLMLAGQIAAGLCSNSFYCERNLLRSEFVDLVVTDSYKLADALLAEHGRTKEATDAD